MIEYPMGGQGGLVVKRPPGNQKVGVQTCTEGAPMVHQDLSGRPADQS